MSTRLHPSFIRASASILGGLLFLTGAVYLWQGYYEQLWWSRGYMLSLLIPLSIAPLVVCMIWVPTRFEYSEKELRVQLPFRALETVNWDELEYYGWLEGVYGLQFRDGGTLAFLPSAFPRREWRALKAFLRATFPDREASGFVGSRFFRWPRSKP